MIICVMGTGAKATAEPSRVEARTVFIMMIDLLDGIYGQQWKRCRCAGALFALLSKEERKGERF